MIEIQGSAFTAVPCVVGSVGQGVVRSWEGEVVWWKCSGEVGHGTQVVVRGVQGYSRHGVLFAGSDAACISVMATYWTRGIRVGD
jgi:hypothetical protein